MARDREVAAFGERARHYDEGRLGELHHLIADRAADLALTCAPAPRRILDLGCGTGYLLGLRRGPGRQTSSAPLLVA
jgi:SAM-dependent methyltransferase